MGTANRGWRRDPSISATPPVTGSASFPSDALEAPLAAGTKNGGTTGRRPLLHTRHQFRLALCGHKAVEVGAACAVLMVHGDLAGLTLTHLAIAAKTGLLAMTPALGVTFTRHAHLVVNRWTSVAFLGVSGFVADTASHGSHYPGVYNEALLTAIGGAALAIGVSYTPLGRRIERLAESWVETRTHR